LFIDLCATLLLIWISSQVCIQSSKASLSGLDFLAGSSPLCSLITSRSFVRSRSAYLLCSVPENISASFWFSRAGIHASGFVFLAIACHGIIFPLVTSVESVSCSVARAHRFICCRWLVPGPCAAGPVFIFFLSAKSAPPIRCAARACLGRLRQFWILPSVLFSQLVFASVFVRFRVPEYQAVDVAGGILGSLRFCSSFFISSCATGALLNSGLIPGVVLEKAKFFLVLFVFMW
jgi:hypothetical protein